eukprot:5143690-Pyramimonas_sp.AAC.1
MLGLDQCSRVPLDRKALPERTTVGHSCDRRWRRNAWLLSIPFKQASGRGDRPEASRLDWTTCAF